ncbi:MAG: hypothetical protein KGI98_16130 [Euryarchaeota archaeon]|nr:hypothetical protein [Euryarchaeota archaeon]MDE1879527.1 hypothetical protein [Euryarchaeota archaeon]
MKNVLGVALLVAFVAVLVGFVSLGVGTGALSFTTPGGVNFAPTWHNDTGGTGGALVPSVYVGLGSLPIISSNVPGDGSTTLSFGMAVTSNGNCGNAGDPAWSPGWGNPSSGGSAAYYVIQFIQGGNPIPFSASVDGGVATNETMYAVATNNQTQSNYQSDPYLYGCFYNPPIAGIGGGNVMTNNYGGTRSFYMHTVQLYGLVGAGTLRISLPASGPLCDAGSNAGGGTTCYATEYAANSVTSNGPFNEGPKGTWSTNSYVDVPVLDGSASLVLDGSGPWFNGGTVTVTVSTGYAGPGGYALTVYNPGPRGGGVATGWGPSNPLNVSNNVNAGQFTFSIPAGASINCTTPKCNQFSFGLENSATRSVAYFPVDISPKYAPGLPGLTYSDSQGLTYPVAGDTLTLTFYSNGTSNNTPASFLVYVWYLQPGQSARDAAPCSGAWVTACSGTSLTVGATSSSGNSTSVSASYSFTVSPTLHSAAIGVQVQAETQFQQSSGITYRTIDLSNCTGGPCNPNRSSLTLWSELGPVLLTLLVILGTALVAVWAPNLPLPYRVLMVALAVLVMGVLFAVGTLTDAFKAGGVFASVLWGMR